MSIILKGIDLPKDIGDIISINLYDKKNNWLDNIEVDRKDIIEIPTPHGRLIDENKAKVGETIDGYFEITAPTILEKEG